MLRYIMLRNYLIDFRTKHYSFYGSACVIFHPIFTMYYNEENIFFFLFQDVVIYFESLLVTTLVFFHFAKNFFSLFLKSLGFLYFLHWNWKIVINIKYKQKFLQLNTASMSLISCFEDVNYFVSFSVFDSNQNEQKQIKTNKISKIKIKFACSVCFEILRLTLWFCFGRIWIR